MNKIYNIPFGLDFCDILAEKLLNETKEDALKLAEYVVILPTSRASRNLQKAFSAKAKNMILPQIISLNMIDEDDISLLGNKEISQTISNIKRGFVLTSFIMEVKAFEMNKAQALQLAFELGNLFDKIETQKLSIKNLDQIIPEEFSEHWQVTLEFLYQVYDQWQEYLQAHNLISKAEQRNLILKSQQKIWQDSNKNIIIAGFSSTIPAMLDLMKTVYHLPNGEILIQGLDRSLEFSDLSEVDYLYGVYEIINHLDIDKKQIADFCNAQNIRQELTSLAMLPSDKTTAWRLDNSISRETLKNTSYIECENEQNEAEIISLILRKELETPVQTVSLITPDRNLARCVASNLEKWNITANDSSGQPMQHTPVVNWLKLVLNMVVDNFSPVSFLACMKHPFASCGENKASFKANLRTLEKEIRKKKSVNLSVFILDKISFLKSSTEMPFADFLKAHILLAEQLASTDDKKGSEIIWKSECAEEVANFIHEIFENSTGEPITIEEYETMFSLIISGQQVRKKYGFHPRLSILGLTESRLTKTDVTVLGGLNEGIWPPEPDVDGWMSRPMKKDFGMLSPDVNIGLSAFDFSNAFNFDKVYLTRAKKSNTSINIKSRFINRLEGVLQSKNLNLPINLEWEELAKKLNHAEFEETQRANPCPHVESRFRDSISVSAVDILRKDPYAFYASRILKLKKLDDVEEEISVATKGTIIHACLEEFIKQYPKELPENAEQELLLIGQKVFDDNIGNSNYYSFWWPKFENIVTWFIDNEKVRREINGYQNLAVETSGSIDINGVKVTAKADRIDVGVDGVEIIDYKTGNPPSMKAMETLRYVQLPIEALIANANGFGIDKTTNNVSDISVWSLKGKAQEGNKTPSISVSEELLNNTDEMLSNLISYFQQADTTYPAEPNIYKSLRYNDYEHLSRLKLWRDHSDD